MATCFRDAIKITPDDLTLYLNLKAVLEIKKSLSREEQNELAQIESKIIALSS